MNAGSHSETTDDKTKNEPIEMVIFLRDTRRVEKRNNTIRG